MNDATPQLSTPWSRSLGLTTPIVSAPMGGVAGGRFADAVSRAGALGTIGMGSSGSATKLAAQLAEFDAAGGADARPFGIGMVHWGLERDPAMLDVALEARPTLVSVGFATRFDWVARVHDAGALAATQVYTAAEALVAADAGVDVIVARGAEGGGHGDPRMGTLALLDAVLDALDDRRAGDAAEPAGRTTGRPGSPAVLAAGGIASGRSLAAVLAAGADAAWIGTAFIASPETLTPESARPVIFAATGDDTVNTTAADAALALPWPERFPERVIRNAFVDEWEHRVPELRTGDGLDAFKADFARANAAGEHDVVPFDAGQGVGLLRSARPVADIIDELTAEASRLLARRF
ncbi:nitronate monooxygenase [Agromyces endophyticus]|uniref:NAD(P)H-dependent flavin oxidoreductase n=1 Tax=Agromyces sp. H17E-10 TaxID=2932244 RepID=UPI001FD35A53|nr:nitronate monooxygenase [Agromyces sp. H17E-10]UOQ90948.1 nitronate monooxygenase [Agromyces sp. H17E-10]